MTDMGEKADVADEEYITGLSFAGLLYKGLGTPVALLTWSELTALPTSNLGAIAAFSWRLLIAFV